MGHLPLDILRLYRLHTGGATAAVPVLAGFIIGAGPLPLLLIAIGSFAHHAWGFSLNEIVDLEVDARSGIHGDKPLVSGRISKTAGHVLSLFALVISMAAYLGAAIVEGGPVWLVMAFILGATAAGAIYDIWGKRFPLSDVFVGLWLMLLVFASASTGSEIGGFGPAVIAAAVLASLHLIFNNSVEGGIKDADGDRRSGVRSLAVLIGVRWRGERLKVPPAFMGWGIALRGCFVVLAAVFSYLIAIREGWLSWFVITVSVCGVLLFTHALGFMGSASYPSRALLLRKFSVHEVLSLGLSLFVVAPAAGIIPAAALLIGPLLWFILLNRIMYGSSMSPKV